jgi:glycosyltransferase involved in cell wall biosynthesis
VTAALTPSNALRVLVVSDGNAPSATQRISFGQPFDGGDGDAAVGVSFEPHHEDAAQIKAAFDRAHPELLVLSRYTSPRGIDWIALARDARIPVVYHIDDDLLAVPESLGAAKFKAYNRPERVQALRDNIEASDLFYVSTGELKKRYEEHGVRAPTVAGDVYCSVAPGDIGALVGPATGPVIGYMGTGGHSADLAMVMPAVCEVMDEVPSLNFEVFGTIKMPGELERFGRRVRHVPPVADYADFIPYLRSLGWWVGLAPLEDNAFNRCKADTKWVEYSLAGMAVVASDTVVYRRACEGGAGLLACGPAAWRQGILDLLLSPALRAATISAAQRKLEARYTHEQLRRQVLAVFSQAFELARQSGRVRDA